MTGEATTGSRLNRTESPSPSLLNTVYSEAGWFGVIFPVFSQTLCMCIYSGGSIRNQRLLVVTPGQTLRYDGGDGWLKLIAPTLLEFT